MRQPEFGVLQHLALHAAALRGTFLGGHRTHDARDEQPVTAAQVGVPGDELDVPDPGCVQDLEEVLEFAGAAGQSVQVVDQHAVSGAGGEVGQHAQVLRAGLAGVGGQVVVDVLLADLPPQVGREPAAVLHLAADAESFSGLVAADAGVDRGGPGCRHRESY
ncbi:hypothetical protein OF117_00010 [Geodermatophilus sp. YIM 151500]|nr:hypothetical protein [Geodermatophilus sp. YIM 151500]MCV2487730.1 hypothetical protein [Geodermatophilus sp. YIM 151500]